MLWSNADDAMLDWALETCRSESEASSVLSKELGRVVSLGSMRNRCRRRGISSPTDTIAKFSAGRETPGQVSEVERAPAPESGTPTADHAYVDVPTASHRLPPLDCGSRTLERVLILPDTHAPYHDAIAWGVAMEFARKYRPDTVVHLGDWLDAFTVSDHDKDPRRGTQLIDELTTCKHLRSEVDDLGAARKIITLGNHEDRLWRYCVRHAPALVSMLSIENLLELPQHGWHVVPYRQHGSIGHLGLTHEAGFAGVHAVHHTGVAFASSVAFGHTHRLGSSYFGDIGGKRHVSASLGWLGSMPDASYEHEAKRLRYWTHGFGTAEVERNGNFHLNLHAIVDGRVVCGGEICG